MICRCFQFCTTDIRFLFQDKHEENHQPKLHGGLVIKHNANQRYATNAVTSFIFREIAKNHELPVQVSFLPLLDICGCERSYKQCLQYYIHFSVKEGVEVWYEILICCYI